MIRLKRIYDPPSPDDGCRVLVDRLWPRGLSKEAAAVDLWLKEVAPSAALRQWFGHDPKRWETFGRRYAEEVRSQSQALELLRTKGREGTLTLLFAARDLARNNAVALKNIIEAGRADAASPMQPQGRRDGQLGRDQHVAEGAEDGADRATRRGPARRAGTLERRDH